VTAAGRAVHYADCDTGLQKVATSGVQSGLGTHIGRCHTVRLGRNAISQRFIRFVKRLTRESFLIGAILLLALCLRLWGIAYDLPYIYHPDEPIYIRISQNIFKSGDLNPHFFNYPSLFFYINSLAYIPYYLVGKITGALTAPADVMPPLSLAMGVTQSPMPISVLLGRIVTVIFGVATVALTYALAKNLTDKALAGGLASLIVAVSPTNVSHSRFVTPDTYVTFFVAASCLAAMLVYRQRKMWQYLLAGACIGLTASTKYNGALVVVSFLAAHFLRFGKTALVQSNLYLALFVGALAFLGTTPFSAIDSSKFLADIRFEARHYSTGHAGMEGNTLTWYLDYMARTSFVVYLLSGTEIVRAIWRRHKETLLLSAFPVVYFVFIASLVVRNDRTFLPLTVFSSLLAASLLTYLLSRVRGRDSITRVASAGDIVDCVPLDRRSSLANFKDYRRYYSTYDGEQSGNCTHMDRERTSTGRQNSH
jgi:4-amino-4-deoxy-L-arabinose transferase-like glycosyltransferase